MQGMQADPVTMQTMQSLLTARQVQDLLGIDRSTVYRMADDGRLPAIRVGKQWRFPREHIYSLLATTSVTPTPSSDSSLTEHHTRLVLPTARAAVSGRVNQIAAQTAVHVAAELLGVTMVVTDMAGEPITSVVNPCEWFSANAGNAAAMATCAAEWRELADEHTFNTEFQTAAAGFQCARSFVRSGHELVAMVVAGGINQPGENRQELHKLSPQARSEVLRALPLVAAVISRQSQPPNPPSPSASMSRSRTQMEASQ